jgi:hypothetical protein
MKPRRSASIDPPETAGRSWLVSFLSLAAAFIAGIVMGVGVGVMTVAVLFETATSNASYLLLFSALELGPSIGLSRTRSRALRWFAWGLLVVWAVGSILILWDVQQAGTWEIQGD